MTDKTATVPVWQDGDPLMEAIAAAVYEHCEVQRGTGLVIDDPRNIAAAVVATIRDAARQAAGQPAEAWPPPIQSPASTRLYDAARTKADATVGHADDCEWHTNEHSYCSCFLWPAACAGVDAMYDAAMDAAGQPDTQQPADAHPPQTGWRVEVWDDGEWMPASVTSRTREAARNRLTVRRGANPEDRFRIVRETTTWTVEENETR